MLSEFIKANIIADKASSTHGLDIELILKAPSQSVSCDGCTVECTLKGFSWRPLSKCGGRDEWIMQSVKLMEWQERDGNSGFLQYHTRNLRAFMVASPRV